MKPPDNERTNMFEEVFSKMESESKAWVLIAFFFFSFLTSLVVGITLVNLSRTLPSKCAQVLTRPGFHLSANNS